MTEETQSTIFNRRRVVRGPLVVTNPGNESDDEDVTSYPTYKPPPLPSPSPTSHSPYSEQSSQLSTSYGQKSTTPLTTVIPDQSHTYVGRSNPSLSSPSGSSSPAVETTPPPSTPGHPMPFASSTVDSGEKSGIEAQQQNAVPRMGITSSEKFKHYAQNPHIQTRIAPSRTNNVRTLVKALTPREVLTPPVVADH